MRSLQKTRKGHYLLECILKLCLDVEDNLIPLPSMGVL